jgi:hypothetical protein
MLDVCASGRQATENLVYMPDICAGGWRTTEKSTANGGRRRRGVIALHLNSEVLVNKNAAIRIITSCAKQYCENLANRNILFAFSENKTLRCFEALALPRHYLHLTGVDVTAKNLRSSDFYKQCLTGQLPPSIFELKKDGTTEMKLSVLHQAMNIHKTAKMIGDFNWSKSELITDKIVGTVTACVGFQRDNDSGFYVPNTVLRQDIRNVVDNTAKRVLAIYRKDVMDKRYSLCTYQAKDVSLEFLLLSDELKNKIDTERIYEQS